LVGWVARMKPQQSFLLLLFVTYGGSWNHLSVRRWLEAGDRTKKTTVLARRLAGDLEREEASRWVVV